ncbi:hypothetical protein P9112_012535 [Eukaryota sp. TZLM1-RC]
MNHAYGIKSCIDLYHDLYENKKSASSSSTLLCVGTTPISHVNHPFVPFSIYLDINDVESPPDWNVIQYESLQKLLYFQLGIHQNSSVVVYSTSPMIACRVIWALCMANITSVFLLDGGIFQWIKLNLPTTTTPKPPHLSNEPFLSYEPRLTFLTTSKEILDCLADCNTIIADVRTLSEHNGETSGYDYIAEKGKIPGSLWALAGLGTHDVVDFIDEEGMVRPLEEIGKRWTELGIKQGKKLVFYCGTGWRASVAWFIALNLECFDNVSLYDGGWLDFVSKYQDLID